MNDITKETVWYVSFYEHCGKEWDMLRTRVTPDDCPICGEIVEPVDYMEDNEPELDWDFDGERHNRMMYDY